MAQEIIEGIKRDREKREFEEKHALELREREVEALESIAYHLRELKIELQVVREKGISVYTE